MMKNILLVDDEPVILSMINDLLRPDYHMRIATNGQRALELAATLPLPDLVLLDINIPLLDGYQVCARLRADPLTASIPIIFLSSHDSADDITRGLELGAVDYVPKPVIPSVLLARVKTHLRLGEVRDLLEHQNQHLESLVLRRTEEVGRIQELSIIALGELAETRDNETGNHIHRTQAYVRILADNLASTGKFREALASQKRELIWKSAPLHDIGKVGIPDSILRKPTKLDSAEFEIMKSHTVLGYKALESAEKRVPLQDSYLRTAREIARWHHERWDGGGYPDRLSGEAIPVSARLMAVADVYDALISARVYKPPFSHAEAVSTIRAGRGSQFDPDVTDCFMDSAAEFLGAAQRFRDDAGY